VAANDRFLVHEGGAPFFWLGDTAWAIFEKAVREAAGRLGSGEKLIFGADVPWAEALDAPGRWST
jgi:hypothetical protein